MSSRLRTRARTSKRGKNLLVTGAMLDADDLTSDQLLDAWRDAEIDVNGTRLDTPEHAAALRRADEAREAYLLRIDTMKDDLRDG